MPISTSKNHTINNITMLNNNNSNNNNNNNNNNIITFFLYSHLSE